MFGFAEAEQVAAIRPAMATAPSTVPRRRGGVGRHPRHPPIAGRKLHEVASP
jgi:hypothetical protein